MGLFSGKTVTTVGTSVSRVIQDSLLPDATSTGVLKYILEEGDNVSDYVMEELVSSVAVRAERMYAYAKKNYTYGLPSGQRVTSSQGKSQAETVLTTINNASVDIDYCYITSPNDLHIGWMTLVNSYGYSASTNQLDVLSTQKGTPVYLKDMVVVVPESMIASLTPGALAQWGTAARAGYTPEKTNASTAVGALLVPSPIYSDPDATVDHVLVTIVWETTQGTTKVLNEDTFTIPVDSYNDASQYIQVKYIVNGLTKYWMYEVGSGVYSTIDALLNTEHTTVGTYFPFLYFRYGKVNQSLDNTSDAYKTSKKMAKYIGLEYDTVADAIDENPDIGQVEQAMMMLAVPANTENETERRYLFDFFDELYSEDPNQDTVQVQNTIRNALNNVVSTAQTSIVIQDKRFKMALTHQGIYKRTVAGNIGDVDSHDSGFDIATVGETYTSITDGVEYTQTNSLKTHYYRRQITASLYEEIRVVGLKMVYYIYGDYTTTGDEDDDILLIPVDRAISSQYPIPDRETLYARSLHFIFNSKVDTHVKWYQTGVFQIIIIIIAIIITVLSEGADGGSAIGTALGVSGALELIAIIVVNIIIGKLITVAAKLFVQAFGEKIGLIVAIIAILYGGYQVLESGSLAGAPFASDMLKVSNGLTQAVIASEYKDLLADANEFKLFVEEQTKLLEETQELLDSSSNLSPFVIFGESPNDFYNRTVHSGNIGVLGIDAITNYVDVALTLPTLNETIGGNT